MPVVARTTETANAMAPARRPRGTDMHPSQEVDGYEGGVHPAL